MRRRKDLTKMWNMKDRETVMRGLKYFYLYKVLIFNPSVKRMTFEILYTLL